MVASLQLQALSTTVTSVPPRLGGGGGCCKPLEWREFLQWSRPWEATLKFTFTPGPPQSLSIYHSRATLSSIPCTKAGFSLETYDLPRLYHGQLVSLRSPAAFLETSTIHWPLPLLPGSEEDSVLLPHFLSLCPFLLPVDSTSPFCLVGIFFHHYLIVLFFLWSQTSSSIWELVKKKKKSK